MVDALAAVGRAVGRKFVRVLPGWMLRSAYPVTTRRDRLQLFIYNGGPRIGGLQWGSPRMFDTNFVLVNLLPFKLTVRHIEWQLALDGATIGKHQEAVQWRVPPCGIWHSSIDEMHLESASTAALKNHKGNCMRLSLQANVMIESPTGDFEKYFSTSIVAEIMEPGPVTPVMSNQLDT